MSKRQVNEKLFKLIVKVLTENSNDIWITHLIELVQMNSTLDTRYIFEFITIMIRKELISVREVGDTCHVQLTPSACQKYRELNYGKIGTVAKEAKEIIGTSTNQHGSFLIIKE
jgi:hypothetical protein